MFFLAFYCCCCPQPFETFRYFFFCCYCCGCGNQLFRIEKEKRKKRILLPIKYNSTLTNNKKEKKKWWNFQTGFPKHKRISISDRRSIHILLLIVNNHKGKKEKGCSPMSKAHLEDRPFTIDLFRTCLLLFRLCILALCLFESWKKRDIFSVSLLLAQTCTNIRIVVRADFISISCYV